MRHMKISKRVNEIKIVIKSDIHPWNKAEQQHHTALVTLEITAIATHKMGKYRHLSKAVSGNNKGAKSYFIP